MTPEPSPQSRHCVRCDKGLTRAAKLVKGLPVCSACAFRYSAIRPCSNCGTPSNRLSRSTRLGFTEPVCDRCRTQDHATCAMCRRYRLPVSYDISGKPLCKHCTPGSQVTHRCPACNLEVPG